LKVSWEFVRMKRHRRQGTREERSSEAAYWRVLGSPRRARTDSKSSGPELVQSARVWHLRATCYVYSQDQRRRGGGHRKRHRDWVHMSSEYFNEMQMHEDFALIPALQWDNLWSSACRGWKSSLYEDPAELQHTDRPYALDMCNRARSFTHQSNTCVIRRWAFLILGCIDLLSCTPPPATLLWPSLGGA